MDGFFGFHPNMSSLLEAWDRLAAVYEQRAILAEEPAAVALQLHRAGADDVVREYFDASLRVGRYVLENAGLSEFEANEIEKTFYKLDRAAVRDLAEVWKPGVPSDKNPQYIARARELNRELEAALLSRFADKKKKMIEDDAA